MLFESLAKIRQWSDAQQIWLLQCVFTGKVQEAFPALSMADGEHCEKVKQAVLKACKLVPEAYRQKFRASQKQESQAYVEFVQELTTLLDPQQVVSGVSILNIYIEQLRELIFLE